MDIMIDLFSNSMFMIPALVGLVMLIVGLIWLKYPPKEINALYGYRTKSSMKTQQRWEFAQKIGAKEMIIAGVILLIIAPLAALFNLSEAVGSMIALAVMLGIMAIMIVRVEMSIQKKFGKN